MCVVEVLHQKSVLLINFTMAHNQTHEALGYTRSQRVCKIVVDFERT